MHACTTHRTEDGGHWTPPRGLLCAPATRLSVFIHEMSFKLMRFCYL